MTEKPKTGLRRGVDFVASEISSMMSLISICGAVIACAFNVYVFKDWNINYFQIASINDIFMSSAYVIFSILMAVVPSIFILAICVDFGYGTRLRRIHLLKKVKDLLFRRRVRFVFDFALGMAASAFFIYFFMLAVSSMSAPAGMLAVPDLSALGWGWLVLVFLSSLVGLCVAIVPLRGMSIRNIRIPAFGPLAVFLYCVFWSLFFVNPYTYRWYGFFGERHIVAQRDGTKLCDGLYLRWMGESKSVLECWKRRLTPQQVLFILDNQSGALYGPILARPGFTKPIAPPGPVPPPNDRLTPEEVNVIYGG